MSHEPPSDRQPLKLPVLHILLALTKGELHGLGIADEAEMASDGAVTLGPGTLYRSLDEMRASNLVEKVDAAADAASRRKYYRITKGGRRLLQVEMARLERLVDYARDRKVLAEGA